jgi:hypothetical protein
LEIYLFIKDNIFVTKIKKAKKLCMYIVTIGKTNSH